MSKIDTLFQSSLTTPPLGPMPPAIGIAAECPESAKALETKIFVLCDYAFIAERRCRNAAKAGDRVKSFG
ncbi:MULTISPECIES: hypothetical protein [unclassified Mesorhizobium]|uniref:hypothetical protein n=1 Tax=unclassified Mesorhizobium TaxID=325217 RepID=UPI000FCA7D48|nr:MULTISPECIES: hypothetical protein [unclassified Mesorhizobium]RUV27843.1 hypothetical protein EOA86_22265 [Mesorhizobium sp. M5C.F.Ca.IN.020.32.2.1]RUV44268.1 hypothetical protein EOA85_36260 [Mesorhizobium sp. M5C.F.Ca.IN.020.29.1.1]RWC38838.1 MAG: hypothetical protein EOS28_28815 [Mesorhizobium sp.]RWE90845.1 MAG: hypothetical protein EOS68_29835 [Mesorhizobium sp.]RWG40912.1 MAG: hypothetical protein EOQ62_28715 [Mesorhizobium sp.]